MTYPTIAPNIRVEETISNPFDPAQVIGFTGRDTKLGRPAVVAKQEAIEQGEGVSIVQIPRAAADLIEEDAATFVVLLGHSVLAMTGSDFNLERRLPTVHRGGQTVEMADVRLDSEEFREFDRDRVRVGN